MRLICKIKDEVVDFQQCMECSKTAFQCPVSYEYIKLLYENHKERERDISVTKLLGCPRKSFILSKELDYAVDVLDLYYRFRGGLTHLLLENFKDEKSVVETVFERKYKEVVIKGKPDKIDVENGCIYDFKTITGKIGDDKALRWGSARKRDIIQLNLYYWLVEEKLKINSLVVIYFGTDYLVKKVVPIYQRDTKKYIEVQKCLDKAELLGKIWDKPIEYLSEIEYEHTWECDGYCDVKSICEKYIKRRKE